ncbi:MAG TPA: hypothetical protein PKZ57_02480 [Methanoregulaceae archaeon]|nr:hypothetical protein [Methanoregulaceae archaeon]
MEEIKYSCMYLFSMDASQGYLAISITILAIVALLLFIAGRKKPREDLSGLVAISLALITAGIVFGENLLVGYSLIGAGVLLAVIDIYLTMTHQ